MRVKDAESFIRLATQRTNRTIKYIRLIGNLSNRSNYAYTEAHVRKIFTTLRAELSEAEARFMKQAKKEFRIE